MPHVAVRLLVLPLLFSACIPLTGGRSLQSLPVADKQGVNTLVADNGSTCEVPEQVFARILAGDAHLCAWAMPGSTNAPAARDGIPAPRRTPVIAVPSRIPPDA